MHTVLSRLRGGHNYKTKVRPLNSRACLAVWNRSCHTLVFQKANKCSRFCSGPSGTSSRSPNPQFVKPQPVSASLFLGARLLMLSKCIMWLSLSQSCIRTRQVDSPHLSTARRKAREQAPELEEG